jgi:hypothetical protein
LKVGVEINIPQVLAGIFLLLPTMLSGSATWHPSILRDRLQKPRLTDVRSGRKRSRRNTRLPDGQVLPPCSVGSPDLAEVLL